MYIYSIIFSLVIATEVYATSTLKYLEHYGYISKLNNESIASEKTNEGLRIFQEYWNLPVDGTLNEPTKNLLSRPRCGVSDNVISYHVSGTKWHKNSLTWYFYGATEEQIRTATEVFKQWSSVSGLNFKKVIDKNADIVISFRDASHRYVSAFGRKCTTDFQENALGHAFVPHKDNSTREVHLMKHLSWEFGMGKIDPKKISLYWVLLHEIGHSLGVYHSFGDGNLMNPLYYHHNNTDTYPFSEDDINAIQYLYKNGNENKNSALDKSASKETATSSPIPTTTVTHSKQTPTHDDICRISPADLKFFISRKRMYVFYDKWAWPLSLSKKKYEKPQLITNWLSFLPDNFTRISAIYEKPSGDVVLFADNNIYEFNHDSLKLNQGWPKSYQSVFGPQFQYNGIKAAVLTNSGIIYIFYGTFYVVEMDDCSFTPRRYIFINSLFSGVSVKPNVDYSVFKYTNGRLYIMTDSTYHEYDEFLNVLVKSGPFDLSIFGIDCPMEDTIVKLQRLMSKLLYFYGNNAPLNDYTASQDLNNKNSVQSFSSLSSLRSYMRGLW